MPPVIAAELLRLRTLRSPRYGALGGLAFMAILAVSNIDSSSGRNPAELADSLRSMAVVGVLLAGVFAATFLATEFQRGSARMTYLSHPDRARVAAARALVYAGLGFLFAALATGVLVAVGASVGGASLNAGFSAADVARMIGGAAAGGAVMGTAGALLGTAVPNPTMRRVLRLELRRDPPHPGRHPHVPALRPSQLADGRDRRHEAGVSRRRRTPSAGCDRPPARLPGRRRADRPPVGAAARPHLTRSHTPTPTPQGVPMPIPAFLIGLRARLTGAIVAVARHAARFFHFFPPS